jgi:hypothetical protein
VSKARLRSLAVALAALVMSCLAGCDSLPAEALTSGIEPGELSAHVHFLAQPALKGRSPRSAGSKQARSYIADRFRTYGLRPWGDADGYDQPFGYGTNVVGVLPGSDETLADEVVLVCAHYDHLGTDKRGQPYCGAADNASGVATLLEIAERFALSGARPRRTVCFAAFDCEERGLLGAFAFTLRKDFRPERIAAVVNVDMVGRDSFDVLPRTLFLAGSRRCLGLRAAVLDEASAEGVRLLPFGTDLVGPVGDHVAFENLKVPVLFFTCGWNRDYHKTNDTPEKLDYDAAAACAELVCRTTNALAGAAKIENGIDRGGPDPAELQTIRTVCEAVSTASGAAGLSEELRSVAGELDARVAALLSGRPYSSADRRDVCGKVRDFAARFEDEQAGADDDGKTGRELYLLLAEAYDTHRLPMLGLYRRLVRYAVEHRPGLLRGAPPYSDAVYDLGDDMIRVVQQEDGNWRLSAMLAKVTVTAGGLGALAPRPDGIKLDLHFGLEELSGSTLGRDFTFHNVDSEHPATGRLSVDYLLLDCVGSRVDIADFCLLFFRWHPEDASRAAAWDEIMEEVAGEDVGETYADWLAWRLALDGCPDENEWFLRVLRSPSPAVQCLAAAALDEMLPEEANEANWALLRNPRARPSHKAAAMAAVGGDPSKADLLLLVDSLDDASPLDRKERYSAIFDGSSPFRDHPMLKAAREEMAARTEGKVATLGLKAAQVLGRLTGQNFGQDAAAWREWIEGHAE